MLLSVTPWIANLELNKKWAGTPSEDLLNLMYGITEKRTQHGSDVRELWLTATKNASNFSAILDFVLSRVVTGVAAGPASASKVKRSKYSVETAALWPTCDFRLLGTCHLGSTSIMSSAIGTKGGVTGRYPD